MREAYRLKKHILYEHLGEKQMALFFIFGGKVIPEYQQIEEAMNKGIQRLIKVISSKNKNNEC